MCVCEDVYLCSRVDVIMIVVALSFVGDLLNIFVQLIKYVCICA